MKLRGKIFVFLMLIFFCSFVQAQSNSASALNVTIINRTNFDIEIIDDTRIIPRHREKQIQLPVQRGELVEGYTVTYRIYLLGDIYIKMRRHENIIITRGQETAIIASPDFTARSSFLVLENNSTGTVSLKKDRDYLKNIVRADTNVYVNGSTTYLKPGGKNLYDLSTREQIHFR